MACSRGRVAAWAAAAACALAVAAVCALSGCAAKAIINDASPRLAQASISAGSDLTEASQYVEVRLSFDAPLQASGDVAGDVQVLVNGEKPNDKTIAVNASVDGSDVVVRLSPAAGAGDTSSGAYFALYDGLVSVAAASDDGGLPHVSAADGQVSAVLSSAVSFTVPSGVQLGGVQAVSAADSADGYASVSFDVESFARLRCCSWVSFGDGLPIVMMHNHEFARDTEKTCAQRFADTVNANYADSYSAECDGARVTVRAVDSSVESLAPELVQGALANPAQGEAGSGALSADAAAFAGVSR